MDPEEKDNEINDRKPIETVHQQASSLPDIPAPIRSCLGATCFLFMTLLLVADIVTDVLLLITYGVEHRMAYLGAGIFIFTLAGLYCAMMYVLQIKSEKLQRPCYMGLCLVSNIPFQLGILVKRLGHTNSSADQCCSHKRSDEAANKEWFFAKLKLLHAMFQSSPMLILNAYSILMNGGTASVIQYVCAGVSATSLVLSSVLHEKLRKEKLRGTVVGPIQTLSIFLYKSLIILSRVFAIVNFVHYYGSWLAAMILCHFSVIFVYFIIVYRDVWKIGFHKILLHSIYCCIAYFPLHNEYRPEGEIMIYYTIYMAENMFMIALPYAVSPTRGLYVGFLPGSHYYKVATVLVLIGSALGLLFMALYYFFFHKSRENIRYILYNCLERFCPCLPESEKEKPQPSAPFRANLYVIENGISQVSRDRSHDQDGENLLDHTGPPPSYHHSWLDNSGVGKSVDTELDYTGDYGRYDSDAKVPLTDSDYPPDGSNDTDMDTSQTSSLPCDATRDQGGKKPHRGPREKGMPKVHGRTPIYIKK